VFGLNFKIRWWEWVLGGFLLGLKFWLVSGDEITASYGLHDDRLYLQLADRWYWGQDFNQFSLIRPPVYPLWVALVRLLGWPLILVTHFFQMACAGFLALTLARFFHSRGLGWVSFVALGFHPLAYYVNSRATPDSFYASGLWLLLACLLILLASREEHLFNRWSVGLATVLALLWHTRAESLLLFAYLALFAVLDASEQYRQGRRGWKIARRLAGPVGFSLLAVGVSTIFIGLLNFTRFGAFTTTDLRLPGFNAVLHDLVQIEAGPPVPHVPVSRAALAQAFAVSPTLRNLQPWFDGEDGRKWATYSQDPARVPNEIQGPWWGWALRDLSEKAGHYRSIQTAERFYLQVHRELEQAFARGQLQRRSTSGWRERWFSPSWKNNSRLGRTYVVDQLLARTVPWPERDGVAMLEEQTLQLFDQVASRRAALTQYPLRVAGWIYKPYVTVTRAELQNDRGEVLAHCEKLTDRPDANAALQKQGFWQGGSAKEFYLAASLPFADSFPGRICFFQGKTMVWSTASIQGRFYLPYILPEGWYGFVDLEKYPQENHRIARHFSVTLYQLLAVGLLVGAVSGILVLLGCRTGWSASSAAAVLMSALVLGRLLLLGLLEADLQTAFQPRYVFPVAGLGVCSLAVWSFLGFQVWKNRSKSVS
jgi:hypothetical protein